MNGNVLHLALRFDESRASKAFGLLTGRQKFVLVEGEYRFLPGEQFAIIAATNQPALGIATVAKVEALHLSVGEAIGVDAIFARRERMAREENRIFTRIYIGEVNIVPMSLDAVLNRRYTCGDLDEE